MARPLALDLFCCGGGAAMGLHRAGFDVIGIDIKPQPHYPFPFIQGDATRPPVDLAKFDFIWASPPCEQFSVSTPVAKRANHENLIPVTRALLEASGKPWVMENVMRAPLRPDLVLDGTMFPPLRVVRRRKFEASFLLFGPHPSQPERGLVKYGGWSCVVGNGTSKPGQSQPVAQWKAAMGIDWLPRRALVKAIPPAYSEYIGLQALRFLGGL